MNNKEFMAELARRIGRTPEEISDMAAIVFESISECLQKGDSMVIQSFGTFEVKKKSERISVNPATGQRMLIPPKIVPAYKPSIPLKEKFK